MDLPGLDHYLEKPYRERDAREGFERVYYDCDGELQCSACKATGSIVIDGRETICASCDGNSVIECPFEGMVDADINLLGKGNNWAEWEELIQCPECGLEAKQIGDWVREP